MATLVKRSEAFHLKFHYRGKAFWKTLGHVSDFKAARLKEKVELRLEDLKSGVLRIPESVNVAEYLVRGEEVPLEKVGQEAEGTSHEVSFVAVREAYLEYVKPRRAPNSLLTEIIHLRHFERLLGEKASGSISGILRLDVENFMTRRSAEVSKTTVNKELQTVRQLFEFALKRGLVRENPALGVARFKRSGNPRRFMTKVEIDGLLERGLSSKEARDVRRFRYLTGEEVGKLLELAKEKDSWLYPVLVMLAFTGMRRGEVVRLEWADVDFKAGVVWVRSRKQSRSAEFTVRDIEMHPLLAQILFDHRKHSQNGQVVFPSPEGDPTRPGFLHKRFRTLVRGTDFDGIGLHCLRHSFASNLACHGVDQRLIDHFMGHQTEGMRKRYQHLFPQKRLEGIRQLPYGG